MVNPAEMLLPLSDLEDDGGKTPLSSPPQPPARPPWGVWGVCCSLSIVSFHLFFFPFFFS